MSGKGVETATATPEDVQEVIAELEQYRQRLIDDTVEMAKKVKMAALLD